MTSIADEIEKYDEEGNEEAVESILNARVRSPRPTKLIRHHKKEGMIIDWYAERGFNLKKKVEEMFVAEPDSAIPEGTEEVIVSKPIYRMDIPSSVKLIYVEREGYLGFVPAVKNFVVKGKYGTLTNGIREFDGVPNSMSDLEVLDSLRCLRLYDGTKHPIKVLPQLTEMHVIAVDPESLAVSRLEVLSVDSVAGLVFPPTLRDLSMRAYTGESLPDDLESLSFGFGSTHPARFPPALLRLSLTFQPILPFPSTLTYLSLDNATLDGLVLPESLRELYLYDCGGPLMAPSGLTKLNAYRTPGITIGPKVQDASFCHCKARPDVYKNAESLETLSVSDGDASFCEIPVTVKYLTYIRSPKPTIPRGLIYLKCDLPGDFESDDQFMSALSLDSYIRDDEAARGTVSSREILRCKRLRRLEFTP